MKPSDIFNIIVRAFGVFLIYEIIQTLAGFASIVGAAAPFSTPPVILRIVVLAAGAVWFLFGAPPIQQWAFPERRPSAKAESKAIEETGRHCVSCEKPIPESARICPSCGYTQPA
ncbi:MAG: hypothetical protein KGJ88_12990 [Verrucomicrobiota bacterium]|nr:hypothetical protein [Verrucomicrobiota bacterium]